MDKLLSDSLSNFLNVYVFHWTPSRAIWIGGYSLSWDARCSGIYIGFGASAIYQLIANKNAKDLPSLPLLISFTLFFFPLMIDVMAIKFGFKQPSNDIRYLTGLLFGMAFSVYLFPVFTSLFLHRRTCKNDSASVNSFKGFGVLLVFIGAIFFLKRYDHIATYFFLETLAFWGFISLFGLLFVFSIRNILCLLIKFR